MPGVLDFYGSFLDSQDPKGLIRSHRPLRASRGLIRAGPEVLRGLIRPFEGLCAIQYNMALDATINVLTACFVPG